MTNLAIKSPLPLLAGFVKKVRPYLTVSIFLLLAAIYGFMVVQINSYSSPAIEDEEILAETKASPTPKIDQSAAEKLESLKDNSVNVQTLFQQGRTNPFQE